MNDRMSIIRFERHAQTTPTITTVDLLARKTYRQRLSNVISILSYDSNPKRSRKERFLRPPLLLSPFTRGTIRRRPPSFPLRRVSRHRTQDSPRWRHSRLILRSLDDLLDRLARKTAINMFIEGSLIGGLRNRAYWTHPLLYRCPMNNEIQRMD